MSTEQDPKISGSYIGLQMDTDPLVIRDGEYTYCYCGAITHKDGNDPFIGNMNSNELMASLPQGYMIIGSTKLDRNDTALLLVNLVGNSEIGIYFNGVYTKVAHDKKLNFSIRHGAIVRFKSNYKEERIIYWTDDYNPPRWLNLDNPNFIRKVASDGCSFENTTDLDLDFMKIFKDYVPPCLTVDAVTENGNLKSGGYYFTGQYADVSGNGLTACFPLIGDVPIFQRSLSESFDSITGVDSEQITSKAVTLGISGADTSFTHMNIIAVKVVNGTLAAFKIGTVTTSATRFVYNGAGNREEAMLLDEVIRPAVKYSRAGCLDVTNTQLLLGDLRSAKEYNLQPYFQKVQVQWQSYKAWSDDVAHSYKNPIFATYMRSFRRDEVYALGAVIDWIDGTTSKAFHIPGRKLNKKADGSNFTGTLDQFGNTINPLHWDDDAIYSGDDLYDNINIRHKIYNTATIEGTLNNGSDATLAEYGEMGFYESTNLYDCNKEIYGDDAGKPIRHHLFPDSTILHIHDGEDGVRTLEERVKVAYMGIKLPNILDVIASMPQSIREKIKGWRIVIGDRTYDKSVLASGIMLNALKQDWDFNGDNVATDTRFYPNYPLNDLRPDPYINQSPVLGGGENGNPNTQYNKDAFFFHSPDTHFKKQFIVPGELKINVELYGDVESRFEFMRNMPQFREKGNDNDDAAIQGYSIGWYNNYTKVPQNNIRRKLKDAFYVPFNSKVGGGSTGKSIWNVFRESSVFVSTGKEIANPTRPDTSRFIMTDRDSPPDDQLFGCTFGKKKRNGSIYYGTVKNPQTNQYGNLFDIRYIDTYGCKPDYLPADVVFGGDTYIGKFNLKIQNIFYQNVQSVIDADHGIDGTDFKPAMTVPYTHYYYRNNKAGGSPRNQSRMMCEDNTGHGLFGVFGDGDATALGYLAMALYGIPVFWAESDFNIDLRHTGNTSDTTFYPNLNNGAYGLSDWLHVRNVDKDNTFKYNEDFSRKNDIKLNEPISPFYDPLKDTDTHYNTRCVYSLKSQPEDIQDNWLAFKPLDYYDLPKNKGSLIDIRYIGNYKTLFRMRDSVFMDILYGEMETSLGKVQLGSGKLFEKEPKEILSTENGYGGTLSKFAFNNTEYGPMFPSANSQKCFAITDRLNEITEGADNWLSENLPFKLAEQIKVLSVDNACNPEGIGLLSEWDRDAQLWFVTKRDYEVIDPANIPLLHYKADELLYLGNKQVSLHDKTIFRDCSWTFSFAPHPKRRRWISWYPFIPNFYFVQNNKMFTGLNDSHAATGIYRHGMKGSYQTFYGKKYPFIIEGCASVDGVNTVSNPTVTFLTHAANTGNRSEYVTFNKAILYNNFMCSGLLNLIIQDENKLSTLFKQLKNNADSRDIALRIREGHFNFSDFYDIFKHDSNGLDFFTNDWSNPDFQAAYPIDKVLDTATLNYKARANDYSLLREKWIKYRYIFDNRFDIKLLLQLTIIGNNRSDS